MFRISESVLAAIFLSLWTTTVTAQTPCGPDGAGMIASLQKEWGEDVKSIGMTPSGNLVQWLANDKTGTWSMVVIMPNGFGCLIHSGDHWYVVPPVTEGAVS